MDFKKILGKGASLAAAPQKYLLNKAAEGLGVRGSEDDSEASSQAIVENLAGRVGIPEDSTIGNAAKAAGVAGLEMFGDPLGFLPVGKIAKFAPKIEALKALKLAAEGQQLSKLGNKAEPVAERAYQLLPTRTPEFGNVIKEITPEVAEQLGKLKVVDTPKQAFGKVSVKETPKSNYGKVKVKP